MKNFCVKKINIDRGAWESAEKNYPRKLSKIIRGCIDRVNSDGEFVNEILAGGKK
jgi:hypothetical protein